MKNKAWDMLTDEEKASLSLSINHGKSSWQAGEILKKSHYKYLEIEARAKEFFSMFTEYFRLTNNKLIPENSDIPEDFKKFIELTLVKRYSYREAVAEMKGFKSRIANRSNHVRVGYLKELLEFIKNHKDPIHRELHALIINFDRWNNNRILPIQLQAPSAFKRRNKARWSKHLKNIYNLDPLIIHRLLTKFNEIPSKVPLYLPIVSHTFVNGYEIVKIKKNDNSILKFLSEDIKLYVFLKYEDALAYADLVCEYVSNEERDCKVGQHFWPEYRRLIAKAYNYEQLNNLIPRLNSVELLRGEEKARTVKYKTNKTGKSKLDNKPENRVDDSKFWE